MAADTPAKQQEPVNPCCTVWKEQCAKLKDGRMHLREALNILNKQVEKLQAENIKLMNAFNDEHVRAETEKLAKEKELAVRVSLENEISALNSEISSLHKKGSEDAKAKRGEIKLLQDRFSEGEKEINRLKELLEKEKVRADSERKNAGAEKKSALEAWKLVKVEKAKADDERKLANSEGKKAEQYRIQMETLKQEANETKSKLESDIFSLESEISSLKQKGSSHAEDRIAEIKLLKDFVAKGEEEIIRLGELLEKEKIRADFEKNNAELGKSSAAEAWKLVNVERARADEERKHADIERKKAEEYWLQLEVLKKETDEAKSLMGNEFSAFRSEIFSLQQGGTADPKAKNGEVNLRQDCIAKYEGVNLRQDCTALLEGEISQLKELLEKEKLTADYEKKNAEAWKNTALETLEYMKAEKAKADEERKQADEYWIQLEVLKKEAGEAKSKLVSETLKLEEAKRKVEAEAYKVAKKKKRADSAMSKLEKQRMLAEASEKFREEKPSENLSQQLVDAQQKIKELQKRINNCIFCKTFGGACVDESAKRRYRLWLENLKRHVNQPNLILEFLKSDDLIKNLGIETEKGDIDWSDLEIVKAEEQRTLLEVNKKMAMEEKSRVDQLSCQVEENKREVEKLQKQIQTLLSPRKLFKTSAVSPDKDMNAETIKVKLLEKRLKLEKMRLKHAKEVAVFEKSRNIILLEELGRLKMDFSKISCHLDVLGKYFSPSIEATGGMKKAGKVANKQRSELKRKLGVLEPFQICPQNQSEFLNPGCTAMAVSEPPGQTHVTASLLPTSRGSCDESVSGTDSKLESLLGGSCGKLLSSSAINSSSASFSDSQFVGSQDRDAFGTASGKLIDEDFMEQPSISGMSGEVNKIQANENFAVVAENSVRSHSIDVIGRVNGRSTKKVRMINGIESVEFLSSEGKKLHLEMEEKLSALGCVLNKLIDRPLEEPTHVKLKMQDGSYSIDGRCHKKRKVSHEENVTMHHMSEVNGAEKTKQVGNIVLADLNACRRSSYPTTIVMEERQAYINDSFESDPGTSSTFEEVAGEDYMKLLDLESTADEDSYRRARERPMSPTLPEIEFSSAELSDVNKYEPLVDKSLHKGMPKEILVPSHSLGVIDAETGSHDFNQNASKDSCSGLLHGNGNPLESADELGRKNGFHNTIEAVKVSDGQAGESTIPVEMSSMPGDEALKLPFQCELGSLQNNVDVSCVVLFSSMNDTRSISRIIHASRTCMARCSLNNQSECMLERILNTIKMEEELLPREKTCVLFTLLLLNCSACTLGKSSSLSPKDFAPSLDSFVRSVNAVMSNVETRKLFAEVCFLDELLGLIEDFLINGRVIMFADGPSETLSGCDSRIDNSLNGISKNLSSTSASMDKLVVGCFVLGSICLAINHIEFICETSYNLLRMRRYDTTVVLTMLHIFAYLGGERFLSSKKYGLMMTVLKSIVLFLEGENSSVALFSCFSAFGEVRVDFCSRAKCPFSEDVASIDIIASEILEKIQTGAFSGTLDHCRTVSDIDECCGLNKCVMPGTVSNIVTNGTLCDLSDILSLVELVVYNMSWEWTCDKVIPKLLEMLERPNLDYSAVAIVVLLGQIGRRGVSACGYEDKGIADLQHKLSDFLKRNTNTIAAFPIQIAVVTALQGLISLNFDEVIKSDLKHPETPNQSAFADLLRNWYSLLSKEQQAIAFSHLQSAGVDSN